MSILRAAEYRGAACELVMDLEPLYLLAPQHLSLWLGSSAAQSFSREASASTCIAIWCWVLVSPEASLALWSQYLENSSKLTPVIHKSHAGIYNWTTSERNNRSNLWRTSQWIKKTLNLILLPDSCRPTDGWRTIRWGLDWRPDGCSDSN